MAEVAAVYDEDLRQFLGSIGVLHPFENGQLLCHYCKVVVDESNLHAIFPDSGQVRVVCDQASCQEKLIDTKVG